MTATEEQEALAEVYADIDKEAADRIWKAEREMEQWERSYAALSASASKLAGVCRAKQRTIDRLTKENEQLRDENNTLREGRIF